MTGRRAELYRAILRKMLAWRSLALALTRRLVFAIALILILFGAVLTALETPWGKNRLRGLLVGQANQYLTAQLTIGRLEGSLFRGLELGDIKLVRDGRTIISIE